ncbi:MAG: hypothetical protein M1457_13795 [bacterium]|nr:hypothetical protein [bacterium]
MTAIDRQRCAGRGWAALASALALLPALWGCTTKETPYLPPRPVAYTAIPANSPEITTLGALEGPYQYVRAATPTTIILADDKGTTQAVVLLGLLDDRYGPPAPPPGQTPPAETPPTPEELEKKAQAEKAWHEELDAFARAGLDKVCDKAKVFVLRMSGDTPPKVYLFMPESQAAATTAVATGAPVELVNAVVLRKGLANMELGGIPHPFYDMMLDCQLASIVETAAAAKEEPSIWSRFQIKMPAEYGDQLKKMAEQLQ